MKKAVKERINRKSGNYIEHAFYSGTAVKPKEMKRCALVLAHQ